MNNNQGKYKCPCCGYFTLDAFYGEYDICPVCFWEEDSLQFKNPIMDGGANQISLIQARINYKSMGVSEERLDEYVRPPLEEELHGIAYDSPKGWYDDANNVLYIRYYWPSSDGLVSYMDELNWRKECFLLKKEYPMHRKPLSFRETIRKLSTYEIKKALFQKCEESDIDYIRNISGYDYEQLQELSDNEMKGLWDELSKFADSGADKDADDIREKLKWWADPCWDVPEWMVEW